MAERNIFIVNATQVVTSELHPEGLFSVIPGYPKTFDSLSYSQYETEEDPDGAVRKAFNSAKAEYYGRLSQNYGSDNRAKWTVTLNAANGQPILSDSYGAFPVLTTE